MSKTALLVGAGGLVGQSCLQYLLDDPSFTTVRVLVRKPLDIQHPKLEQIVLDFDSLEKQRDSIQGTDVFCCLGTTIKVAGTKENFFKVDFTYVLEIARIAREKGAKGFYLVSAMGADAHSFIFYSKVKGQLEEAVKSLGFESLYIFRPSLLLGERKEQRTGEKIGVFINDLIEPLMVGPLKKYKGIQASQVAKAMVRKSTNPAKGTFLLLSDEIQAV